MQKKETASPELEEAVSIMTTYEEEEAITSNELVHARTMSPSTAST